MTNFISATVLDRLYDAEALREPLALTAQDVADLVEDIPGEDAVNEQVALRVIAVLDGIKISKAARKAILDAVGYED